MQLYYIAAAYGESTYSGSTYSSTATTPTPTTPSPTQTTGTGANPNASSGISGVLQNTGFGIMLPLVFSIVLIVCALVMAKKSPLFSRSQK